MNNDNGEMLVSYHPNRRYTDTPAVGASYYFDPWQRNCADGRMKITVATFAAGQNDPVPFPIFALMHVAICNTIPDPFAHAGAGAAYRYALAQAAALYCTWEVSGGPGGGNGRVRFARLADARACLDSWLELTVFCLAPLHHSRPFELPFDVVCCCHMTPGFCAGFRSWSSHVDVQQLRRPFGPFHTRFPALSCTTHKSFPPRAKRSTWRHPPSSESGCRY